MPCVKLPSVPQGFAVYPKSLRTVEPCFIGLSCRAAKTWREASQNFTERESRRAGAREKEDCHVWAFKMGHH
jgi:hypothetical protein